MFEGYSGTIVVNFKKKMNKEEFIKRRGETAYKAKLEYVRAWRKENPEKVKEQSRKWRVANPEKAKDAGQIWRAANPKRVKELARAWRAANLQKARKKERDWRAANPEKAKATHRDWYVEHREEAIASVKAWQKSNPKKVKAINKKKEAKRRGFKFIELNDPFVGSVGHHLDKEYVVHIPKGMHQSVSHNVFTGKNMEKINALALGFVYGD